jgi:hypothetical protein
MIYVIAHTERRARNIATSHRLEKWRYIFGHMDLRGLPHDCTIFIEDSWFETPVQKRNEAGKVSFEWPITDTLKMMKALGATVEYVR